MGLISIEFFAFAAVTVLLYYLFPVEKLMPADRSAVYTTR